MSHIHTFSRHEHVSYMQGLPDRCAQHGMQLEPRRHRAQENPTTPRLRPCRTASSLCILDQTCIVQSHPSVSLQHLVIGSATYLPHLRTCSSCAGDCKPRPAEPVETLQGQFNAPQRWHPCQALRAEPAVAAGAPNGYKTKLMSLGSV